MKNVRSKWMNYGGPHSPKTYDWNGNACIHLLNTLFHANIMLDRSKQCSLRGILQPNSYSNNGLKNVAFQNPIIRKYAAIYSEAGNITDRGNYSKMSGKTP